MVSGVCLGVHILVTRRSQTGLWRSRRRGGTCRVCPVHACVDTGIPQAKIFRCFRRSAVCACEAPRELALTWYSVPENEFDEFIVPLTCEDTGYRAVVFGIRVDTPGDVPQSRDMPDSDNGPSGGRGSGDRTNPRPSAGAHTGQRAELGVGPLGQSRTRLREHQRGTLVGYRQKISLSGVADI